MHLYRITFITGFAAGFVVGARAGRERYEQIKKLAVAAAQHPAVQQAAGTIQGQAAGLLASAGGKISSEVQARVPKMAGTARQKVGDHMPGGRSKNGQSPAEANGAASGGRRSHPA
ncbi:MAG: hypothetical protein ACLPS1_24760 [Streptosporangiaceae bacterium]|jgi:hypothetical protein